MADSETRAQRAAALEEKRRKLDELKKSRKRRDEDTAKLKAISSSGGGAGSNSSTNNLDEYIDGLLSQPSAAATATVSISQSKSEDDLDETKSTDSVAVKSGAGDVKSTQSLASNVASEVAGTSSTSAHAPIPKVVEMYAVATQTEEEDFPEPSRDADEEEDDDDERAAATNGKKASSTPASDAVATPSAKPDANGELESDPKLLTAEQVQKEVSSGTFSSFINAASKKVERVLGTPLLADLLLELGDETKKDDSSAMDQTDTSRFITSRILLECPKWTLGRDVTDIDWSPLHRDLLLSTYHSRSGPSTAATSTTDGIAYGASSSSSLTPRTGDLQSAGLALLWSLALPTRPEHIFTSPSSPVTAGRFHPVESPLVLGGLESGQLVVWDVRVGKLPVQKSALTSTVAGSSTKGHTYPLTGMEIIEGGVSFRNGSCVDEGGFFGVATHLFSVSHERLSFLSRRRCQQLGLATSSTDGRLNFWSFASLREPVESLQVSDSLSCFTVLHETGGLLAADDSGNLYSIGTPPSASASTAASQGTSQRASSSSTSSSSTSASRKQVRKLEATLGATATTTADGDAAAATTSSVGHFGLVTALSAKSLKRSTITTSTTSTGSGNRPSAGTSGLVLSSGIDWTVKLWAPTWTEAPLLQSWVSHSYDYMTHVQWSPNHPSLLATASSNGSLGLWNLATSLEDPLTGVDGLTVTDPQQRRTDDLASTVTGSAASSSSSSPPSPPLRKPGGGNGGGGLNKLQWSGDGRRLAVAAGDALHILALNDEISRPKGDEEDKVVNQLMARGLLTRPQ